MTVTPMTIDSTVWPIENWVVSACQCLIFRIRTGIPMIHHDRSGVSPSPASGPRKRRGLWWILKWSLAIIVPLVMLAALLNFRMGPEKNSPLVRVSPQTTFATGPLKPGGDVDYVAYVNQLYHVPPDQNAMVDLIRIMGPQPEGAMLPAKFFQLLGIAPLPKEGDYMEYIDVRLHPKTGKENITATVDGVSLNNEQIEEIVMNVPCPMGQFPVVDQWLEFSGQHLAALRAAVQKPDYYAPWVGDTMFGVLLPHVQRMRSLARSLQASAMRRLGDGDVDGAVDDQIAMLRLGRHVGSQGGLIELLVGTAIEGIGQASIGQTIHSGQCRMEDLQRLAREMDALPPIPGLAKEHIDTERMVGLECVIHIGRHGPLPWGGNFVFPGSEIQPGFEDGLMRSSIDWEVVCIEVNQYYDQLEAALEPAGPSVRAERMRGFEAEFRAMELQMRTPSTLVKSILSGRSGRGRLLAGQMAGMLLPAHQQGFAAGQRITALNATTRIAIALELFRLKNGEYPRKLPELVPEFLPAIPPDPFTGRLPVYRPAHGDPYQLYSLGPNGIDDGGADMNDVPYAECDVPAVPRIRTMQQILEKIETEGD